MTLDKTGKEITMPTKTITPEYQKTEKQYVAPVLQGYTGDVDTRRTYTETEMTNISQTIKEGTNSKDKSSKLA